MHEGHTAQVPPDDDGNKQVISKKSKLSFLKSERTHTLLVVLLFGAVGIFLIVRSFAAVPIGYNEAAADSEAKQLDRYTMRLMAITRAVEKSPGNAALVTESSEIAQARKDALVRFMASNPSQAARYVLPADSRGKLVPDAQKHVESVRELRGKLEVYIGEDFDEKTNTFVSHFTDYYLTDSTGKKTRVYFKDSQESLANKTVRFTAAVIDDNAVPMDSATPVVIAADTVIPAIQKSVAVLVVNFASDARQPYTTDQIKATYFGDTNLSAKRYLASSTYGKTAVSGDVFGYYTIADEPGTSCSYSTWANSAKAEAVKAGVDLSQYTNIVVWWPQQSACSWAGLGMISGSQTWINGYNTMRVAAHELAHNFGSSHASAMQCSEGGTFVTLPTDLTNCTMTEYGDPWTIMGSSSYYELSNVSRQNLRALSASNVKDVAATETFQLQPIEINNDAGINMLRIPRGSEGRFVTVEFRQTGFGNPFDTFPASSPVANGIVLRLAVDPSTYRNSLLLDFNPASNSYSDAPLPVGGTFTDPETGITVTLLGISNLHTASALATVKVDYSQQTPVCTRNSPSLSAAPLSQWGSPGQALAYSATITNNDVGACSEATYDLASSLPSGFSWGPSVPAVKLAPGASATVSFTATSPATVASGYYTLAVSATNTADSTKNASTSINYNIAATTDTTAPSVLITEPASGAPMGKKLTIRAQATDNVGVKSMEVYVDGKMLGSTVSGTLSYALNAAKYAKGQHTILVKAYDASGNMGSASVTVIK